MGPRTVSNIIIDAHRERIRLLKHHSDALSQHIHVHTFEDVLSVKQDLTVDTAPLNKVIHTVNGLQESRFTASGRTDESGDLVGFDFQIYILESLKVSII